MGRVRMMYRYVFLGLATFLGLASTWFFFGRNKTIEDVKELKSVSKVQKKLPVVVGKKKKKISKVSSVPDQKEEIPFDQKSEEEQVQILDAIKAKGNDFYRKGDLLKAISSYTEAIDLANNEKALVFLNNRAAAYLKIKEFKKARLDAQRVVSLEPENVKALFRIASSYYSELNYDEAMRAVTDILKLEPEHKEASKMYGDIMNERAKIQMAEEEARRKEEASNVEEIVADDVQEPELESEKPTESTEEVRDESPVQEESVQSEDKPEEPEEVVSTDALVEEVVEDVDNTEDVNESATEDVIPEEPVEETQPEESEVPVVEEPVEPEEEPEVEEVPETTEVDEVKESEPVEEVPEVPEVVEEEPVEETQPEESEVPVVETEETPVEESVETEEEPAVEEVPETSEIEEVKESAEEPVEEDKVEEAPEDVNEESDNVEPNEELVVPEPVISGDIVDHLKENVEEAIETMALKEEIEEEEEKESEEPESTEDDPTANNNFDVEQEDEDDTVIETVEDDE